MTAQNNGVATLPNRATRRHPPTVKEVPTPIEVELGTDERAYLLKLIQGRQTAEALFQSYFGHLAEKYGLQGNINYDLERGVLQVMT